MNLNWDVNFSQPITQTLHKKDGDPMLYVDEALTIKLNPILIGCAPRGAINWKNLSKSLFNSLSIKMPLIFFVAPMLFLLFDLKAHEHNEVERTTSQL